MKEIGIVKKVSGSMAIVSVQRQSACDSCPGGSVCKLVDSEAQIEAINEIGANVGDTVQVDFKPHVYLKGTIFIYGIPAIMLIIGAIIGKELLSKIFINTDPDLLSAICGFSLFILSIFFIKVISKKFEKKKEYIPVIDSIVSSHN
jgi:sigma-E factor negative regulatory protein RseC